MGVSLDERALAGLGAYLKLLERWGSRINLVGTTRREDLLERHLLDSLAPVPLVRAEGPHIRLIDVGSGAGLPGVPIALACPQASVTLLEPRQKRVNFLRAVARECFTWNVEIAARRLEDLLASDPGGFDIAVSRATFPPLELPRRVGPMVRPGGLLIGFTTRTTPGSSEASGDLGAPRVMAYPDPGDTNGLRLTYWRRSHS